MALICCTVNAEDSFASMRAGVGHAVEGPLP